MTGLQKYILMVLAVTVALPFFVSTSCKKKDKPPEAVITVLDSAFSLPVAEANVRLELDGKYSVLTGNPAVAPNPDVKITDASGQVTFTLKYEAAYFAAVTKAGHVNKAGLPDTAYTLVRFKKNEVNEITILF